MKGYKVRIKNSLINRVKEINSSNAEIVHTLVQVLERCHDMEYIEYEFADTAYGEPTTVTIFRD